jgi:23S rRNA (adenine2503-C2)-methyltransferase
LRYSAIKSLEPAEIYDQVLAIDKAVCTQSAFEYRFMGMGEPLMNYNNVKRLK